MHTHHHVFSYLKNRELDELYATIAIRAFAISMISIFVPIYLLKLDYSLSSVLLFYAMTNVVHALSVIPAAKLSARFGFKHAILFSVPFLILFYVLLYSIEQYNWPLSLLAIICGFNNALFWLGYHVDFCRFSDGDARGKQVSTAKILSQSFHVAGPLVGGVILTSVGFNALFIFVSLLLICSAVPLFFTKEVHDPNCFSSLEVFKERKVKDYLAFMGFGAETGMGMVIWPIFIFFSILNSYTSLGFVSSLSMSLSLVFIFVIGRFSDINRRLTLRVGAAVNTVIWAIRAFVKIPLHVFVIDSFYGVSQAAIHVPFDALSYDKAHKTQLVNFIMFREIMIHVGRAILFIALIPLTDMVTSFLFGGGASLLYFLF